MNEQHGQKCDFVGMDRRDFLGAVARTVPTWLMVTAIVPELLAAEAGSPDEKYRPEEHRYAMAINIHKCIGCGRCADACKTENNVPREPVFFRTWIERYRVPFEGEAVVDSPNGGIDGFPTEDHDSGTFKAFFVPKLCNHCSNAPCVQVCPVGATFTSQDGVVLVDKDYCVGCRYCIQACPYGARYLHPTEKVADKCTFCYHRITKGQPPACVEVCPTQARVFGEMGEQASPISRFMRFNDVTVLKSWLNTDPRVYYAGADEEVR
ncbi:MAG: 4Fe-4S dicluster domain-containing protein [candidate division Zixibacteria bacterium]|nr:4Fe-4S dicluster domain-containing protein [candidate division Zixibacteria bacterium]